jgi:GntR family transcriptional regulator of vanillate catabolism
MRSGNGRTHAGRALVALRQKILSGELPGGTRLFEVTIAEALDISRTPVREAMARLAEEGLLERAAGGGFAVRSFTPADVVDAIELRGVLEGTAARLAAERGVRADRLEAMRGIVARLDACVGAGAEEVDLEAYAERNAEFHSALAGLAGSEIIRRELDRATRLPFASPSAFLPDTSEMERFRRSLHVAQEQHRAIVAAIAAREGTRAEALAREHARIARGNLEYMLSEGRGLIDRIPGLALVVD